MTLAAKETTAGIELQTPRSLEEDSNHSATLLLCNYCVKINIYSQRNWHFNKNNVDEYGKEEGKTMVSSWVLSLLLREGALKLEPM